MGRSCWLGAPPYDPPIAAWLDRLFLPRRRRTMLWVLAGATLALGAAALPSLGTMEDNGVGIIELEFTGTSERAAEHHRDLGSEGRSAARTSLLIDYAYLVAYGLFLAGASVAVADRARRAGRPRLAAVGPWIACGALAAAGFDAVENAMLLVILGGDTGDPWPAIAYGCAAAKFTLAGIASLYVLGGWLATLARRPAAT